MKNSGLGSSAVAARHAAVGVEDDVETLAPERDCDAERTLTLAFVAARDDHRLRRSRTEMPRAEVDAVGGDELHVLVVRLELERRECEIVEPDRSWRKKCAAIHLVRKGDEKKEETDDDEDHIGHR